jgi:hypothetical protein
MQRGRRNVSSSFEDEPLGETHNNPPYYVLLCKKLPNIERSVSQVPNPPSVLF